MNKIHLSTQRLGFCCLAIALNLSSHAATHVVDGHLDDSQVNSDGTLGWVGQQNHRVGMNAVGASSVLVFELPDLGSESVASVSLEFNVEAISTHASGLNADLYGLGYSSSSQVSGGSAYIGAYDTDSNAVALQDNILFEAMTIGSVSTSATGSGNLTSWIQSLYDNGAQAGDYAFVRLSPDVDPGVAYRYYALTSADGANSPVLTIETGSASVEVVIPGHANDQQVDADGSLFWVNQANYYVGTSAVGNAAVCVFQLPDLAGANVLSASLQMNLENTFIYGSDLHADLYGLGFSSSPTVVAGDYFMGAYGTDGNATALQDDFIEEATPLGSVATSAAGGANLASWVQSLYDAGAVAGDYAFVRVTADNDVGSTYRRFLLSSADSSNPPVLTLDIGSGSQSGGGSDPVLPVDEAFSVSGNGADAQVNADGSLAWGGQVYHRVGFSASGNASVYVFPLPDLDGQDIATASLELTLEVISIWGSDLQADLYGLRWNSSSQPLASDYFVGAYGTDTSAVALQDDLVTESTPLGSVTTNASGSANLASWLQSLYNAGAQPGDYAFIRVSADNSPFTYRYYQFASSDATAGAPVLEISTQAAVQNQIWVDQAASVGTPDGSSAAPYATIQAGLDAASAGDTVVVRAGEYREGLVMPSGQPGNPISLTASGSDRVIVSGMKDVTNWWTHSGSIKGAIIDWSPTQFFVGTQKQVEAKAPNEGWWLAESVSNTEVNGNVTITDSINLKNLPYDLTGASVYIWTQAGSIFHRCPIVSIDTATGKLTFEKTASYLTLTAGDKYYLVNQVSLIDQPGEWSSAVDGTNTRIHFYPEAGADLTQTQANHNTSRVILCNNASHVRISGLEVTGSLGDGIYVTGSEDIGIYQCIVHNNQWNGIRLNDSDSVEVINNVVTRNRFGVQMGESTSVLVEGNDIGHNYEDGLRAYGNSNALVFTKNYIHHHSMWGHPDNLQFFGNPYDVEVSSNFLLSAVQSVMSESVQNVSFSDNTIVGSSAFMLIFGHGNSGHHDVLNNTLAYNIHGCLRMTWTDYTVQENVFFSGNNNFIYGTHESTGYLGDYNVLWNLDAFSEYRVLVSAGPAYHSTLSSFQTATGYDAHSVYANPQFENAPLGISMLDLDTLTDSTRDTLILIADSGISVGDHVEIDFDGVVRTVTSVSADGNTIQISPELDEKPIKAWLVANWGSNTNFSLNLSMGATSPAFGLKNTGTSVGSAVSISNYQAGDFDGDGIRDLPVIPVDLDF